MVAGEKQARTPLAVLVATSAIGLALAVALTVVSAEIYDAVAEGDGIATFDQPVLDQAIGWRTPQRTEWVTHFTDLGSLRVMPILTLVVTLLLCRMWRSWTPAILMAIAVAGSLIMTGVGKLVVGRPRPDTAFAVPPFETSAAFPSGHALNSWVIALLVAYLVCCRVHTRWVQVVTVVLALAFAVAMGLSRVYLGHHWLTDVLVAWALGLAWLLVVTVGHRLAAAAATPVAEDSPITAGDPSATGPESD